MAAEPAGKRRAGVAVRGTLYRRTWHSVRKQGMGGSHYFVTRPVESAGWQLHGDHRGNSAAALRDHGVPKAGYYVLRLRAQGRARQPAAAPRSGSTPPGADYVPWRRDDESRLELVTDRKSYKVGQVARILVKSPFSGAHGLLHRGAQRHRHLRRPLKLKRTSAWLEVPITEELIPNAFVSVMLVRGRIAAPKQRGKKGAWEARGPRAGRPSRWATPSCRSTRPSRKLTVRGQARARRATGPARRSWWTCRSPTPAASAGAAELTVFAADEGVLSLIGYKTPDPMSHLLRRARASRCAPPTTASV